MTGGLADALPAFAKALRAAGIKAGTDQVLIAAQALAICGIETRHAVHTALRATLVTRQSDFAVFDAVFDRFWMQAAAPSRQARSADTFDATPPPGLRRALEGTGTSPIDGDGGSERDAAGTWSARAQLMTRDFAQMSTGELAEAAQIIRTLSFAQDPRPTRRRRGGGETGRIDMAASLRAARASGGAIIPIIRTRPVRRPDPLVALCDVSGSMAGYSRMLLLFLHALTRARARQGQPVTSFVFGTGLTNITRALARRDVDAALADAGRAAGDWGGGTRIGEALSRFNRDWARRVLARGATVLLVTDGLDRGDTDLLGAETARLRRSCRRLVWLNPLLRFAGFEPRAAGIRALRGHVDVFLPAHSLDSLAGLADALSAVPRNTVRAA